ncbi:TPR repeat-containing protein YsoA [Anoxybacillus voinovskiensis]|nr:TPR repeat-containing protein YsoA [Anoxybacillus voinovskiensis]
MIDGDDAMKKNNIVRFPHLHARLLEKGWEALQEKQYETALQFFLEASELKSDSELEMCIVVCFVEIGEWKEAKARCQQLLEKKKEDVQLLQMYVSILLQLQQYEEMETVIRDALAHRFFSPATRDHLLQLLQFSEKMQHRLPRAVDDQPIRQLLESPRLDDQLQAIQQLENEQVVSYLPLIQAYLWNEANHPMAKTMVVRLLTAQRVNEQVTIRKFGQTMTVIPAELDELATTAFAINVLQQLERTMANDNPSLYEVASHLWHRYIYALYPFPPLPSLVEHWAAALHICACHSQGIEEKTETIAKRYGVGEDDVMPLCKKLYEIEEISFI